MKRLLKCCIFPLLVPFESTALTNGGFEEGALVPAGGLMVQSSPALPGWAPYTTFGRRTEIFYNTRALAGSAISIHDFDSAYYTPVSGRFAVLIQGGILPDGGPASAWIEQSVTLPADTRSIIFTSETIEGAFQVSFAGEVIPFVPIAPGNGFASYGADMTRFAGTSGTLSFLAPFGSHAFIDDIELSTFIVPEPSTASLIAAGAAFLLLRRTRRQSIT